MNELNSITHYIIFFYDMQPNFHNICGKVIYARLTKANFSIILYSIIEKRNDFT